MTRCGFATCCLFRRGRRSQKVYGDCPIRASPVPAAAFQKISDIFAKMRSPKGLFPAPHFFRLLLRLVRLTPFALTFTSSRNIQANTVLNFAPEPTGVKATTRKTNTSPSFGPRANSNRKNHAFTKHKTFKDPVKNVNATTFKISGEWMRYQMQDPGLLMQAGAVAYRAKKTNKMVGFKIVSIEPKSVFRILGLKEGDIIKKFDGHATTSIAGAQAMYASLGESKSGTYTLELERKGKPLKLKYLVK